MDASNARIEIQPCYYCGLPATSRDHTVPKSLLENMRNSGLDKEVVEQVIRIKKLIVPCCVECNSSLGKRVYRTLHDRKRAAKAHKKRKYKRILKMPSWANNEVIELGPNLQQFVLSSLGLQRLTRERLGWQEGLWHSDE